MKQLNVTKLAEQVLNLLPSEAMAGLTVNELTTQLAELLYGDRGSIPALEAELITLEEAADAITAKLETWLIDRSGNKLSHGVLTATTIPVAIARALSEAR
jgi:hypothetical protein